MSDVHGRVTKFLLDNADGALQDITTLFRKIGGLPGKTDRPESSGFAEDAQRYEVLGKSEAGAISLGGFWKSQALAKIHGRTARILIDRYALSGSLRNYSVNRAVAIDPTDGFGEDWKRHEIVGKKSGGLSFGGKYNSAVGLTDERFWAALRAATPAVVSLGPVGFAIGSMVDLVSPYETSFTIDSDHATGPVPVSAEFVPDGVIDLGIALHDLVAEIGTGTTNYASVNEVEATSFGWAAHLHVSAYTAWTNATIKIQDSADDSAWADLAGATFTVVTAVTEQRLVGAAAATVRQYVRAVCTTTGVSGSITFAVTFARRGSSYGAAGSFRHLYELYGKDATSSYEYGPEGGTTGKVKFSGEARLSKLDLSITHDAGPVEFSAELMADGAPTKGTFA